MERGIDGGRKTGGESERGEEDVIDVYEVEQDNWIEENDEVKKRRRGSRKKEKEE